MNSLTRQQINLNNQSDDSTNELHDVSSTGRKIAWKDRKMLNTKMVSIYDFLSKMSVSDLEKLPRIKKFYKNPHHYEKRADRMYECARFLTFATTISGRLKLQTANFCRVRMCPMCVWRRSLKLQAQLDEVLSTKKAQEYAYIFLTLTVPNVSDDDFEDTIKKLHTQFKRLFNYKDVTKVVKGYFRATEFTFNKSRQDWHPHIHVLIAVNPSYFTDRSYISQAKWLALWQKAMKDNSIQQVDVRKVKRKEGTSLRKTVCEVAKYPVKDTDYIDLGDDIFSAEQIVILDRVLERKRFVAWSGVLKDIRVELKQDDAEDENADLIHATDELEDDPIDKNIPFKRYQWLEGVNAYYGCTDESNCVIKKTPCNYFSRAKSEMVSR